MAKSVYSLVLSDEIVSAIDGLAARTGQSRSALINHILAEYASLSTPEARMRETARAVEQAAGGALRGSLSPGGTLTLTGALRYKYNPSLRYVVELYDGRSELGELRVGLRSQNETLLMYMETFFSLWQKLEQSHLPAPPQSESRTDGSRYRRVLRNPGVPLDKGEAGRAIGEYISRMDGSLRAFFENLDDANRAVRAAENAYLGNLTGPLSMAL